MSKWPVRNQLIVLPALCAILICSCCPIGGATGDGFGKAFDEAIVSMFLDNVVVQMLSIQAYYAEYGCWPEDQNELSAFCCSKNWQYVGEFWLACSKASFEVLDDDSLSLKYTVTTKNADGGSGQWSCSTKVQKPTASREEIDETMDELLSDRKEHGFGRHAT